MVGAVDDADVRVVYRVRMSLVGYLVSEETVIGNNRLSRSTCIILKIVLPV